ncbi:16S rRNA (guanine(527)-N(7))-methyltransferase RsmG [Venenivibrio stagnispumantis]|uniref:Ribosomal RNA small subunit methyltransferase G n=1 Tax=Venenivibrio stagnispumantis TaxID=407998 RepID=A0AA45WJ86_9AQUI|nr:16S rRNA (guanine(527)-N(7))-methyltransferase RsmG [Venenivibrio stagnispumantis]MCW4572484.1 16S rRNA (guanine(527)-N(7))-methyltransferase RsmG [Venenivibrio stagnispumantis]SMP02364.1 16S rRNA m(7)G-527 methyltransferase [Venenivibrio stagnispumantis]
MIEKLKILAEKNGIYLTEEHLEKFQKYLDMLLKWNKVYNLTSIRKKEEIITKHFLDSLTCIKLFEIKNIDIKNKDIADFGTGAGFPGVPLKIYYQDMINLFLIESVGKKCIFLEMLSKELNVGYTVLCKRAEEINEKFDIVLSRATGETFEVIKIGKNLLKENGYLIIMKGKEVEEELKDFTISLNFYGLTERKFIVLQKR